MEKAAIYCRLSDEDRNKRFASDDSNSIANQKAMLLQYAKEQQWEVYRIYSDDDYAGADRNRPAFNSLLADAQAKRFDIVLCKTQSRFTRELELVEKYIHGMFDVWGIRFVSIVDNADTANKGNKKSRQINGLMNEWYLEDMSENIKSVLTVRRQNGYHIGAFALYGYKKDPAQRGHLIIDEEAAAVVREVFTLFSQGFGKTAIARILNDRGVPNPTAYKLLQGLRYQQPKRRNSTLWRYFSISNMLSNEIYIGNMVQGKYGSISYKTKQNKPRKKEDWYRVEGTHEPIIARELWDRVQALVAERARPFDVGTIGMFARKVVCANCGYTMNSSRTHGHRYLRCSCRNVSKDACVGAFIPMDTLEQVVIQELIRITDMFLDKDTLMRHIEFSDNLQVQKEQIYSDILSYERRIDETSQCIRELYVDKVKGTISESDFMDMSSGFSQERNRLVQQASVACTQVADIDHRIAAGNDHTGVIEQYTHPEHLTREMVVSLIDHICVGRRAPGEKHAPVEIHWTF